jgi:AcrR family transcriptional regulator
MSIATRRSVLVSTNNRRPAPGSPAPPANAEVASGGFGSPAEQATAAPSKYAQKRPRDRSDQLLDAATRLFSERGYHAVSLGEIGAAVGITGPAVYTHFDSKEAMLVAVAQRAAGGLNAASREATAHGTPEEKLARLLRAGIRASIESAAMRDRMAVYLRETRHLARRGRQQLQRVQLDTSRLWVQTIQELRPDVTRRTAWFMLQPLSGLALGPALHNSRTMSGNYEETLVRVGVAAIGTVPITASEPTLTATPAADGDAADFAAVPPRASRREMILATALSLFWQNGYGGVGIDDIGSGAGISGPGVYRHFRSKEAILDAAVSRAVEQLAGGVDRALLMASSELDALERMCGAYVDIVVDNPALMAVLTNEQQSASAERKAATEAMMRDYLAEWVAVIRSVRRPLSQSRARTMAEAAHSLVNGYTLGWVLMPRAASRAILRSMMVRSLLDA